MNVKGQDNAKFGFANPTPGWYMMEFIEGIKESETKVGDKVRKTVQIPLRIVDGDFANSQQSLFIQTNAEKPNQIEREQNKVAGVIWNAGLYDAFEKQFPGNVDVLSQPVIEGLKIKLPGKMVMVLLAKTSRKNKETGEVDEFTNIMEIAKQSFKPPVKTTDGKTPAPASAPSAEAPADW